MASECTLGCINGKILLESSSRVVDCPNCRSIEKALVTPDGKGRPLLDKLGIPPQYKNVRITGKELLSADVLGRYTTQSLTEVINLLEQINKELYLGRVPSISCYIHVPNSVDIKAYVYGAQTLALEKGVTVTPLVSCNTLYGIQRMGDYPVASMKELAEGDPKYTYKDVPPDLIHAIEGYRVIQHTDLTYYDFINADLCFLEATANTSERGWIAVADILSERAKRGLPTFIVGYWSAYRGSAIATRGLRYLMNPSEGVKRLDLLTAFELQVDRGGTSEEKGTGVHIDKLQGVKDAKSSEVAGLGIEDLMG